MSKVNYISCKNSDSSLRSPQILYDPNTPCFSQMVFPQTQYAECKKY